MAKGDVLVRMKADVGNYNANLAAANRTLKNFREENLSLGGVIKNMTRSFTGYAAGLMSIGALAGKLHETVTEAVQLAKSAEGIRMAFNRLNDPGLLDGLRQATYGTVTDLELMKAAVKFNDFKLPVEELGTMLAFAQQKAKDTGQSVDYMVDSIVTGLGRKSLMILDNLGLSANEIKERMKDTGDMTKAVGAIIREQMAKAGDYVETAADRAAQADVELKNAMEELGRTFMPLQEAGVNTFSQLEIAAIRLLKNAIEPLVEKFTEVGRKKSLFAAGGGNSRVDELIGNLNAARPENREKVYNQQVSKFNSYLFERNRYLNALSAYRSPGGMTDANKKTIEEGFAMFGNDERAIRNQINIQTALLEEYKKRAQEILHPVKVDIDTKNAEQSITSLTNKLKDLQNQRKEAKIVKGSIGDLNKQIQELHDAQNNVTNSADWQTLQDKIGTLGIRIKELKGEKAEGISIHDKLTAPTAADMIKSFDQRMQNFKIEYPTKQEVKLTDVMSQMSGGISSMVSGIEGLGIELPKGLKNVLGGIQSVTSILTGISTILTAIEAISTADTIIPFANGGVVKAASGYRVPGRTFSGDMVPARLNAGELVLNQAQAGVIANALQDREFGGGNMMQPYVDGEKIFLGMNNTSKRMGRGEIVTTSTLRRLGLI